MAKKFSARRYAQAVFGIALERKELDRWQSDLGEIAQLGADAELVALLQNPRLSFEDITKLLRQQLGNVGPLALNLLYLLVGRGRLGTAGDIADEYRRLLDSHRGIEQADVMTAVPLDDADRHRLEERLGAVAGKKIVLKSTVDSSLVGGMVARIGGKLLDGSTRSRLRALKKELVQGSR